MSLLQMSFSGAVLILVIVVIRMIAIHRLPKKTFLALWIIALFRLLVPFSIPSPFSIYSLVRENVSDLQISDTVVYESQQPMYQEPVEGSQIGTVVSNTPQEIQTAPSEPLPSAPKPSAVPSEPTRTTSVPIWTIIWSIGMLVLAGSFSVSYLRCRREFRTSLPIDNDTIKEWLDGHQLKRKIEIRQFSGIMTPMTYGLFHPVILLPENTDWENKQQLQYILYHEYVHIRNYDAALKLLAAATLCVHWFNPVVWVMYILFNRDIELTCDESVVCNFGRENRSAYAKMLISMEERKNLFTPFFNNFSKTAIEERIKSIMKTKRTSVLALILSVVVVVGTAGCFATSVQEDKNDTEQTEAPHDVEAAYDPSGYPVSEEWSFEKICSLIEIDGTPLKFPCTIEETSSINNLTIEDPNDGLGFYDIYYNDTNAGSISFDKDAGTSNFIVLYYYDDDSEENIDGMTFAGYSAEQETEINNFMDGNFNMSDDRSDLSAEDFYRKVYEFEQGNQKMEFTIDFDDSKLYLIRITLKEIEALPESDDLQNVLLPDGMTMDDLRNMLIINGKTLTMPATLNNIMAIDDKFSYEAEYIDDKHYLYQGKNGFYVDILYDKKPFFSTTLASDTNDVKEILDEGIYSIFVSKNVCTKTDIDVTTSYNLNFDSSYEDIVNVFGEPNTKNKDNINKEYEFYDNMYKYYIDFNVNPYEDKIYIITIKIDPK